MDNNTARDGLPFTGEQARRLLSTSEGQQLLALLNRDGGVTLQRAVQALRAGDYATLQQILAPVMQTPQAQQLIQKLIGNRP